jgi:hypothetical protein
MIGGVIFFELVIVFLALCLAFAWWMDKRTKRRKP